ncbi:peptidyl-prolyl cis-trans isomerase B-like [Littorina saxatilis]|uniref:Peptidyl-prolyl cis-trans isomerase n=1 Tax=Littorina saxatilis TaxID=31220 RepID=A0AAN9C844_9CAEN
MLHVRRVSLLLLLVVVTLGQKVEKDGLDNDVYNMEQGKQEELRKASFQEKKLRYLVTEEVFFDIMIGNRTAAEKPSYGRVQVACFGDIVPITCLNFIALAKGHRKGRDLLTYKNTPVHRVIKDFIIQFGDVTGKKGKSGRSIYGETFQDENFKLSNRGAGWVSMANHGRDTNGSQFFILLQPARWLDGKHVVFGKVIKGMDFLRKLGEVDTFVTGKPKADIRVLDCGAIGITSKYEMPQADVISEEDVAS